MQPTNNFSVSILNSFNLPIGVKSKSIIARLFLAVLFGLSLTNQAFAQTKDDEQFFKETSKVVSGKFLAY